MMSYLLSAKQIVHKLQKKGYTTYFAGGWVRDYLMNHPSDDIDIVTSASIEEIQSLFLKTIPVGVRFGIVIVVQENHHYEVATFRREKDYFDGRRPSFVEKASPEEDAKRRDFTINGLFYDPIKDELFDYVFGEEDIKKKIVRAIGDPIERFREDKLRMIRAVRYSSRFRFSIDSKTLAAIRCMAKELFPSVAIERVVDEMRKMSKFPHFAEAMALLHELGLFEIMFPMIPTLTKEEILDRLDRVDYYPKNVFYLTKLLPLLPSFTLEKILHFADSLKSSNEEKTFLSYLYKMKTFDSFSSYEQVGLFAYEKIDDCIDIIALYHHKPGYKEEMQALQQKYHAAIERRRKNQTLLSAKDLLSLGYTPSKELGRLLENSEILAIEKNISNKEKLLQYMKREKLL